MKSYYIPVREMVEEASEEEIEEMLHLAPSGVELVDYIYQINREGIEEICDDLLHGKAGHLSAARLNPLDPDDPPLYHVHAQVTGVYFATPDSEDPILVTSVGIVHLGD